MALHGFPESRLRTAAQGFLPYLYQHVASLVPVPTPGLGTMGVDKWCRVYYDPEMFEKWDINKSAAIILHEDLHILLGHHRRFDAHVGVNAGPEERFLGNIAMDFCCNQILLKLEGYKLDKEWCLPSQFGLPDDLSFEEYYNLLQEQRKNGQIKITLVPWDGTGPCYGSMPGQSGDGKQEMQVQGKPNTKQRGGSCSDGQQRPWEQGPPPGEPGSKDGNAPGLSEFDQKMIEQEVANNIDRHQREKGRGNMSGYLTRLADSILRPKVDPFKALHAAVKYAVSATNGHGDYTWKKLPRRAPAGSLRLPAPFRPLPKVIVTVDTSGSMGDEDLSKALGVIKLGLRSVPAGGIMVYAGDTDLKASKKCFRTDDVILAGGGGTSQASLVRSAFREAGRVDAIVMVTDGETDWPKQLGPRVVVCLTRGSRESCHVPDWMTCIPLEV